MDIFCERIYMIHYTCIFWLIPYHCVISPLQTQIGFIQLLCFWCSLILIFVYYTVCIENNKQLVIKHFFNKWFLFLMIGCDAQLVTILLQNIFRTMCMLNDKYKSRLKRKSNQQNYCKKYVHKESLIRIKAHSVYTFMKLTLLQTLAAACWLSINQFNATW